MATIYAAAAAAGVARLISAVENLPLTRPGRAFFANQNRLEEGISSPGMELSGIRLRSVSSHPTSSTSNNEDSPTTSTGTFTPGSGDESPQREGKYIQRQRQNEDKRWHVIRADIGNAYQTDSFIKTNWRPLSDRWGPSNLSESYADVAKNLDHERGYDRFVQVKCTSRLLGTNIREADGCTASRRRLPRRVSTASSLHE